MKKLISKTLVLGIVLLTLTADLQGVNPAMGSLQDYKDLVRVLHANGMYVIQDMVPRHMHPCNNMLKLHPDGALRMHHLDNHDFNVGMAPFGKIPGTMDERYGGGQKAFAGLGLRGLCERHTAPTKAIPITIGRNDSPCKIAKHLFHRVNLTYNICRCTQLKIVVAPVVSNAELIG
jgi:hypothetical protein